jgi:hypothetical protein
VVSKMVTREAALVLALLSAPPVRAVLWSWALIGAIPLVRKTRVGREA